MFFSSSPTSVKDLLKDGTENTRRKGTSTTSKVFRSDDRSIDRYTYVSPPDTCWVYIEPFYIVNLGNWNLGDI